MFEVIMSTILEARRFRDHSTCDAEVSSDYKISGERDSFTSLEVLKALYIASYVVSPVVRYEVLLALRYVQASFCA